MGAAEVVTGSKELREPLAPQSRFLNPIRVGLTLAIFAGVAHTCWALVVALRWAQPLVDFVLHLHFIEPFYIVEPFNLGTASLLVLISMLGGFLYGFLFAAIWNQTTRFSK